MHWCDKGQKELQGILLGGLVQRETSEGKNSLILTITESIGNHQGFSVQEWHKLRKPLTVSSGFKRNQESESRKLQLSIFRTEVGE